MTQDDLIDRNFEGSIWQTLGFDPELCPHCRSHLSGGICLNACQLTVAEYRIMQSGLQAAQAAIGENDDDICPHCQGTALSPYPKDGGSCPHCFNGHVS